MTNEEIDRRILIKRQLIAVTMQEIEELQNQVVRVKREEQANAFSETNPGVKRYAVWFDCLIPDHATITATWEE